MFDRYSRKTGVQFPEEARGWIMLNRAGLSGEQRAVVISRARGNLKRGSIAIALSSCYPGCGKTIVGSSALAEFEKLWRQRGRKSPDRFNETHQVRFGNGEVDQPHWCSNAGLSWASLLCH